MSTVAASERDQRALMPIGIGTLSISCALEFDVYLPADKGADTTLYRRRTYPFTQADVERLAGRGIRTLYISFDDSRNYRDYVREHILKNEAIPAADRYIALREATRVVLSELLSNGDPTSAVDATRDVSQEMVRTVCDSKLLVNELLKAMSHDYSGFTHAMNVSSYSLLLAKRLGISDQEELLRIGQGALLHDIGMQFIPRRILDKPRKLTDKERQVVQQHTTRGFAELCRRTDLTTGQLMMVYGHHERCDGRGYPTALVRSEIHEHARLCAVVDVYAALTNDRPHRTASRHANVIEYLDRQAGRAFDEEMTRCWIDAVQNKQ
ncbi:MAG TPA: HD domain-containing phosphohydrolase [Pirellulales bacterium]|jgi:HD-GYP domain-containing protein (c-di-GMP phosphodiesterase class II)|nr:HD domain-containing phosphohydrolase [Pirellulales bacterium]